MNIMNWWNAPLSKNNTVSGMNNVVYTVDGVLS